MKVNEMKYNMAKSPKDDGNHLKPWRRAALNCPLSFVWYLLLESERSEWILILEISIRMAACVLHGNLWTLSASYVPLALQQPCGRRLNYLLGYGSWITAFALDTFSFFSLFSSTTPLFYLWVAIANTSTLYIQYSVLMVLIGAIGQFASKARNV